MAESACQLLASAAEFQIGAFIELLLLQKQGRLNGVNPNEITKCQLSAALSSISQFDSCEHLNLSPLPAEFCTCPRDVAGFGASGWIAFGKRLQSAAKAAGFSSTISAGIAGSFQEMADNATRHSDAAETAMSGYQWHNNEFEFVVADAGIGVL